MEHTAPSGPRRRGAGRHPPSNRERRPGREPRSSASRSREKRRVDQGRSRLCRFKSPLGRCGRVPHDLKQIVQRRQGAGPGPPVWITGGAFAKPGSSRRLAVTDLVVVTRRFARRQSGRAFLCRCALRARALFRSCDHQRGAFCSGPVLMVLYGIRLVKMPP
jgi:hypothetical protein